MPRLPEDETATEGLTVRQLVEKHTQRRTLRQVPRARSIPSALPWKASTPSADGATRTWPIGRSTRAPNCTTAPSSTGIEGLRDYLLTTRREAVLRQFNRKLLGYALGAACSFPTSRCSTKCSRQLEQNDYRISAAVETIVRSRQFREIRGKDAPFAEARMNVVVTMHVCIRKSI